jgi:hypothetical protein
VRSRALLKPAFVLFQAQGALQKYFFIGSDFKIAILKSPHITYNFIYVKLFLRIALHFSTPWAKIWHSPAGVITA